MQVLCAAHPTSRGKATKELLHFEKEKKRSLRLQTWVRIPFMSDVVTDSCLLGGVRGGHCLRKNVEWTLCVSHICVWCAFGVHDTDGINSLALSRTAFMRAKHMSKMRTTIIATHFTLITNSDMRLPVLSVVACRVSVPTSIFKFA